jgi:beta-lactamase superfamily II metal-dependent hydrolase
MADERDVGTPDRVGARLAPWRPGHLDIHHLSTGRGDCTLVVAPDGSTLLVDAGAAAGSGHRALEPRPDGSRRSGEWIARYVRRRLADTGRRRVDHALLTHLHPDHIGGVDDTVPVHPAGSHRLTGICDVDAAVGIDRLIDPDHPRYGYPAFEVRDACENYLDFVRHRMEHGGSVEAFEVGSRTQIRLDSGGHDVEVRNLACRGRVWTGHGEEVTRVFPPREQLADGDHPDENSGSAAIRLGYGAFSYFCAGDLTDWADAGTRPWMDALTPAARAAGPVDVAVAPHHGSFDSCGSATVAALAPRVWVVSAWHVAHPSPVTLARLLHPRLYPGPRDVYLTDLWAHAGSVLGPWLPRVVSRSGHVIIRVDPGGTTFRVVVTDQRDERDTVLRVCDPPPSR